MPFGYSTVDWAALTNGQKIAVVFAQLDANLVFEGNAVKAGLFLEAYRWLRARRPIQDSSNNRSFTYTDYTGDVEKASRIVAESMTSANRSKFTQARMTT